MPGGEERMQLLSVTQLCCTLLKVKTQQAVSIEGWAQEHTSGTVCDAFGQEGVGKTGRQGGERAKS